MGTSVAAGGSNHPRHRKRNTMEKLLIIVLLALSVATLTQATCSLGTYETGVGKTDQNVIVNKHNSLRLLLAQGKVPGQPRANNMKRLQYDATLAKAAQNIANSCVFAHVKVEDSRWKWIGQNLYMSMSTSNTKGANWDAAIQNWFNEVKLYHYPDNSNSQTGHYTQVAWATTTYVGCGYTFFQASDRFKYKKLYVCNYGPGGNIIGQAPYKTGGSGCENLC